MKKYSSGECCMRACIKKKNHLNTRRYGSFYVFFNKKELYPNMKNQHHESAV